MSSGTTSNAQRLLYAGFFSIFASGVGFAIRAGILNDWARLYGFTRTELGDITGGGLTGFGIVIILGSLIVDKIGYGRMMTAAFVMHIISAIMTLLTNQVFTWAGGGDAGRNAVFWNLYVSMFLFAIANGMCEVVVNPMTAALFPQRKTHYLNVLHAGWPGGLILGGLASYFMNEGTIGAWEPLGKVHWMVQMSLFLFPVLIYGGMMLGQSFPTSEADQAGVSYTRMLAEFASVILLTLLVLHALVGYVELGTDSWISNITGAIMDDPKKGLLLFVYTSGLMFALRFVAGPLEHRLTPLGLLFVSGVLGCIGLTLLGTVTTILMCVVAATIYALGKTFLWPTMLAVASERFPRGGAIVIGAMGGAGMLSAGLLGGPGIGFKQDYFATQELKQQSPATFERYAKDADSHFLWFSVRGLDGSKVGLLELSEKQRKATEAAGEARAKGDTRLAEKKEGEAKELAAEIEKTLDPNRDKDGKLRAWWATNQRYVSEDAKPIEAARLQGGKAALRMTAFVPATMAVLYLLLILYFMAQGGYKPVKLDETQKPSPPASGA